MSFQMVFRGGFATVLLAVVLMAAADSATAGDRTACPSIESESRRFQPSQAVPIETRLLPALRRKFGDVVNDALFDAVDPLAARTGSRVRPIEFVFQSFSARFLAVLLPSTGAAVSPRV